MLEEEFCISEVSCGQVWVDTQCCRYSVLKNLGHTQHHGEVHTFPPTSTSIMNITIQYRSILLI